LSARSPRTWDELEHAGELDGLAWEYVAPAAACPVGMALHGRQFVSLAEVYEHLPDFAENPACEQRPCACTALPTRTR
jgi:hypothetical protein